MKKQKIYLSLLFVTFLLKINFIDFSPAQGADLDPDYLKRVAKEWEFLYEQEGIHVYSRSVQGKGLMAFRAVGIIKAPLASVLTVLKNVDYAPKWTPNLVEKKILEEKNFLDAITYNHHNLSWPASDRDAVIRSYLELDRVNKQLKLYSHSVESEKWPKQKNRVRAKLYNSNFIFNYHPKGTFVDLDALLDPQGMLPMWIVNFIQSKWPFQLLKSLEKEAQKIVGPPHPEFVKILDELKKLEGAHPTFAPTPPATQQK